MNFRHLSESGADRRILLYGSFLVGVFLTFGYTTDDAYIPLRYAANLLHGHGLVFNVGQRVEGFTSPLGVLVALVVYLIPGGFVLFKVKLVSLGFALLAVRAGARILENLHLSGWADRIGLVTIGLCPVVAFNSGNGLETSLEMWFVAEVAWRLLRDDGDYRSDWLIFVFAFAAVLTRLDALAPLGLAALAALVCADGRRWWARTWWFAGALGAGALSTLATYAYFGSWVPNTFYAKRLPFSAAIRAGYGYINSMLQPAGADGLFSYPKIVLLVAWIEIAFALSGVVWVIRRYRRALPLIGIIVGQAAFALAAGGDYMTGGRFLAPAAMEFIAIEVTGLAVLTRFARAATRDVRLLTVAVGSFLLVATSAIPLTYVNAPSWDLQGLSDRQILLSDPAPTLGQVWVELPSLLRCVPSGATVATSEIGYFGFERQDLKILDLRGLVTPAIARTASASDRTTLGVMDPEWYLKTSPVGRVLSRDRPDVIVEFDGPPETGALGGLYRLVKVLHSYENIGVYERRGWFASCAAHPAS